MMKLKFLGKSGIRVSEISLGAMTFGEDWGPMGTDKSTSKQIYQIYREAGGNFIDTANKYTDGTSETWLGEFMKGEREQIVLATKYTGAMRDGDPNSGGNTRKNLRQSVDDSLKRLQTDYIDLLWVHAWDFTMEPEELMRALDDMVRAGKVLTVGISDAPAWIVAQCNTLAALRGWSPFVGLQIEYSLIERTPERDLIPMAEAFELAITPWSPLGGGVLTGKYNRDKKPSEGRARSPDPKHLEIAAAVIEVANEIGARPAQVALRWLMGKPCRVPVIPIVGARKPEQLEETLHSTSITLETEHRERLDQVSAVPLGFPHDFLKKDLARNFIYGDQFSRIDDPRNRIPE